MSKIALLIRSFLEAEVLEIYVSRSEGGLQLAAVDPTRSRRRPISIELINEVARSQQPLCLSNTEGRPTHRLPPNHNILAIPILRAGKLLGVISAVRNVPSVYDEGEIDAVQTAAMAVAELIASGKLDPRSPKHRSSAGQKRAAAAAEIAELSPSRSALMNVVEILDGCVGADTHPSVAGNKTRLPMSSDVVEAIRVTADAGARVHDSPLLTREHVAMLERLRAILKEYNRTLDVVNGSISKTTKLVWGISKLGAIPVSVAVLAPLSGAINVAIGNLSAVISACRAALGI
ncbi:GAF domain-containing protein [Bradyrhizobium sp. STM 3809]|uniref:GAF domain-containing protein n=1 Tax=Bradyrhizobium sp. STM 3809 TaxID=551936 RepID=UPI0014783FC4|nr:GAF domain-containing protein [Bradyrhizobium sp. STM 3809]